MHWLIEIGRGGILRHMNEPMDHEGHDGGQDMHPDHGAMH
jgi:hypothetical protein